MSKSKVTRSKEESKGEIATLTEEQRQLLLENFIQRSREREEARLQKFKENLNRPQSPILLKRLELQKLQLEIKNLKLRSRALRAELKQFKSDREN